MAERRTHALVACLLVAALALLGVGLATTVAGAAEPDTGTGADATETTETTATAATSSPASEEPSGSPTDDPTEDPTTDPPGTSTPSTTTSPTSTPTTSGPVQLSAATLRWGMSNEANNRAFAPGTFNFFSAGVLPDPGGGGVQVRQDQWVQQAGSVSVQKWDGTAWQPATWAGLGTDSRGVALGSPTAGTFSNHSFVFTGGTGTVDVGAGTAHLAWDGDVSVLFYSGMSFFVLSDPVLDVAGGAGEVRATLSGYASSQSDTSVWQAVPPQVVTIATLPTVDLTDPRGFVATPAYLGVRVTGVPQATTGPYAGAFPQSFVDYLARLGSAAFWHSSGGAADPFKVALPISVSSSGAEVPAPAPTSATGSAAPDRVRNSAPPPPTSSSTPTTAGSAARGVPAPELPPGVAAPAPLAAVPTAQAASALLGRPDTSLALASAQPLSPAATSWPWWTGGGLLLLAALSLLVPPATRVAGPRSSRSS